MPLDKFGRNGDRTAPVYTRINIANLTNSFLRRDGGNTAIGSIDMNWHIIKNVSDPLSNQDVATKNYVDTNAFTTTGGVSDDILMRAGSNPTVSLGCYDLGRGQMFMLLLGTDRNMLSSSILNSGLSEPIKLITNAGFVILVHNLP